MANENQTATIEARVLRVVAAVLALEGEPPDLDSSLGNDLAVDSIDRVTLFLALEEEFGACFDQDEATGLETLREVIGFIEARLSQGLPG